MTDTTALRVYKRSIARAKLQKRLDARPNPIVRATVRYDWLRTRAVVMLYPEFGKPKERVLPMPSGRSATDYAKSISNIFGCPVEVVND